MLVKPSEADEFLLRSLEYTNSGYVYAVVCGERIKIGKSKKYRKRIKSYKPISDNFRVIGLIKSRNYSDTERALLKYFKSHQYRGEWLVYSDSLEREVHSVFQRLSESPC